MASSAHRLQPTFSIEQIELIRRLRNSGLTKEQLLQAFESLERIDSELGNLYTVPISLSQAKSFAAAPAQASSSRGFLLHSSVSQSVESPPAAHSHINSITSSTSQHVNRRFQGVRRVRDVSNDSEDGCDEGSDGSNISGIQMNVLEAHPGTKPLVLLSDSGLMQEVDLFLKKGTEKVHEEIRDFFFANPNFTHSDIALAAGVSVTCVSKFLVGNFTSLPNIVLRRLTQWFLTTRNQHQNAQRCNTSTSKMLRDVVQERLNGGTSPDKGILHMSASGDGVTIDAKPIDCLSAVSSVYAGMGMSEGLDVHFTPRRERFTFRKQHLEILEACFKTNQYPTYEERNEIANRCNNSMESTTGRGLGEKERMTAQNVAYWFSNRRKDIKRLAREGGIDMSEVILPSRVRRSPTPSFYNMSINYMPVDMPSVGPVAFPVASFARTTSDSLTGETGNLSSDSQSSDAVTVKQEPLDEPDYLKVVTPFTSSGRTPGAAVERISSQLLSSAGNGRTGASSIDTAADVHKSVSKSEGTTVDSSDTDVQSTIAEIQSEDVQ